MPIIFITGHGDDSLTDRFRATLECELELPHRTESTWTRHSRFIEQTPRSANPFRLGLLARQLNRLHATACQPRPKRRTELRVAIVQHLSAGMNITPGLLPRTELTSGSSFDHAKHLTIWLPRDV